MLPYNLNYNYLYSEGNFFLLHGKIGSFKMKLPFVIYLFLSNYIIFFRSFPFVKYFKFWEISQNKILDLLLFKLFRFICFGSFSKVRIRGRGYRIIKDINTLIFRLGYSHKVIYLLSLNLLILPNKRYRRDVPWRIYGLLDYQVRNACFVIHSFRKPDIYCRLGIYLYGKAVEFKQGIKPYRL